MYAGVFAFALLLVGTQADSYGEVGMCDNVDADETYDFSNIYPLMYVHAVSKTSTSELVDGVVVNITKLEGHEDVMFKTFDVHAKDGSVDTLYYQDIYIGSGVAVEFIYDEDTNSTLEFSLIVLGQIDECGVLVYYRCANAGKLSIDATQVLKKARGPLSDACEAKVAALIKDKGVEVSPFYVLPYAANNYS